MKQLLLFLAFIIFIQSCKKEQDEDAPFLSKYCTKLQLNTEADLTKAFFLDDKKGFIAGKTSVDSVKININHNLSYNYLLENPTIITNTSKVISYDVTFKMSAKPQPSFFKTLDGGNSWTVIQTPFFSEINDMFFIDENYGFVISQYEGVFKTEDGGNSWKKILASFIFPGQFQVTYNSGSTIRFFNKLEGYIFIDGSSADMMILTQDGGSTWKFISNSADASNPNYVLKKSKLSNDNSGIFINYNDIYQTTDRGNHWNLVTTISGYIYDASFISTDIGYYAGNSGIFKTVNGGKDWVNLNIFETNRIDREGKLFTFSTGEIVTFHRFLGEIYLSEDNAQTFQKIIKLGVLELNDVCFPNNNTGYALGNKGKVFKYLKK